MRYLGGKARTYKSITAYLNSLQCNGQYIEPFVGGAWILQSVSHKYRIASDANRALITMYKHLQNGWVPPEEVTEDMYAEYKATQDPDDPLTAFIGIGCSFSGKWFGGYARSHDRNYAKNAYNSLIKQLPKIQGVTFIHCDYIEHEPHNSLVYCDPPYAGTTGYDGCNTFDSVLFWKVMRRWSRGNTVIISEYNAPEDFECVLEIPTKTDMRVADGSKQNRIEKLFRYRG